jgi:hypothetical protein
LTLNGLHGVIFQKKELFTVLHRLYEAELMSGKVENSSEDRDKNLTPKPVHILTPED